MGYFQLSISCDKKTDQFASLRMEEVPQVSIAIVSKGLTVYHSESLLTQDLGYNANGK